MQILRRPVRLQRRLAEGDIRLRGAQTQITQRQRHAWQAVAHLPRDFVVKRLFVLHIEAGAVEIQPHHDRLLIEAGHLDRPFQQVGFPDPGKAGNIDRPQRWLGLRIGEGVGDAFEFRLAPDETIGQDRIGARLGAVTVQKTAQRHHLGGAGGVRSGPVQRAGDGGDIGLRARVAKPDQPVKGRGRISAASQPGIGNRRVELADEVGVELVLGQHVVARRWPHGPLPGRIGITCLCRRIGTVGAQHCHEARGDLDILGHAAAIGPANRVGRRELRVQCGIEIGPFIEVFQVGIDFCHGVAIPCVRICRRSALATMPAA